MTERWDKFLEEIKGLHAFFESQKKMVNQSSLVEVMQQHLKQITSRDNLFCDPAGASAFTELVSSGPWAEEQKRELSQWANDMLLSSSGGKGTKLKREGQSVSSFACYFNEKDLACLGDTQVSVHVKLQCV